MKKNRVKFLLDIIMGILLFAMYSKNAVNMSFHEIGGLAVCGLFLIHKGLNWNWIVSITKRFFDKSLPSKTRVGYFVDLLLLVSMVFIAVSGIMISKTILTEISSSWTGWKLGHLFISAVVIILVGIHAGLHWSFVKNMFGNILKLPRGLSRPLSILIIAAILIYGGYSTVNSSFGQWLSIPFTSQSSTGGEGLNGGGELSGGVERYQGENSSHGEFSGEALSVGRALGVVASYGSIASVFAAMTILVEKGLKKFKRHTIRKTE
jgi:uncharacterized membrane protein